jgi:hypothetical protein
VFRNLFLFETMLRAGILTPHPPRFLKEPAPELKVVPADKRARPAPAFTSIEEEMASLLGRSTGKS